MEDEKNDKPKRNLDRSFWWILVAVLLILILPSILTIDPFKTWEINWLPSFRETGQIGDTIGGLASPIVGVLSAVLVYKALLAQIEANEELRKQSKIQQDNTLQALALQKAANDLAMHQFRDQLKQQKEQQEKDKIERSNIETQHRMLIQQNFEHVFFQMLTIHHDIIERMRVDLIPVVESFYECLQTNPRHQLHSKYVYGRNSYELIDRDLFKVSSELLLDLLSFGHDKIIQGGDISIHFETIKYIDTQSFHVAYKSMYMLLYQKLDIHLGHYFRNLYRIIKMIDKQDFHEFNSMQGIKNYETRYYYTSIVRAQLSDYEIKWLFFNSLNEIGSKFKPLIEKYSLLKVLDTSNDAVIQIMKNLYKDSAYKKTNPWANR